MKFLSDGFKAFFIVALGTLVSLVVGCSKSSVAPTAAAPQSPPAAMALPGDVKLNLEVWNPGSSANFSRIAARITNWGSSPVALNRLKVRAWFQGLGSGVPQSYVGESWAGNQTLFTANGGWLASVAQPNVQVSPGPGLSCDPGRQADWTVTASFTDDSSLQIPAGGGYVESNGPPDSLAAWHLSNWANLPASADYSRITEAGNNSAGRSNLKYFALYLDDQLVCEWTSPTAKDPNTGLQPCGISGCSVDPSSTPTMDPSSTPSVDPSPTPSVDPSPTLTLDPTSTPTAAGTSTPTATSTATRTFTSTATSTATATATDTPTSSWTPTSTATSTATETATNTATATFTSTATATATDTPAPVTALRLQYMTYHPVTVTNNPSVLFRVINDGTTTVDMTHVEVRYWYDDAGSSAATSTNVDWAGLLPPGTPLTGTTSDRIVSGSFGTQDRYASFTFSQGTPMLPPGQWVEVQSRFNRSDWSNFDQTLDYSYSPITSFQDWSKMTVYLNGNLVWGVEP